MFRSIDLKWMLKKFYLRCSSFVINISGNCKLSRWIEGGWRKLAISAATPWAANLLLKFHIREGFQKMWNLSLLSCWGSRRLTIQNHSWTPKTCYSYGLDCLMFIASISDDFESYHFFAVSGWSSLKMSNNPKRYCILIFWLGPSVKYVSYK